MGYKMGPKHDFGVPVKKSICSSHLAIEKKILKILKILVLLSSTLYHDFVWFIHQKQIFELFWGLLFNKIFLIVLVKVMSWKFYKRLKYVKIKLCQNLKLFGQVEKML